MKLPDIENTYSIHLMVSWILVGIVSITQVVTYPMYRILPESVLSTYQGNYMLRAFLFIGPIMIIELFTGIRLAMKVRNFELHRTIRANLSIIAIIWIITFVFELPSHLILLNSGYNSQLYNTIILFNLLRLLLWILKSWMMYKISKYFYRKDRIYDQDFLDE